MTLGIPAGSPSQQQTHHVTILAADRRRRAMADLLETTHYVWPDGSPVVFDELPVIGDEHDEDDLEDA